jgi:hypothetical protein
MAIRCSTGIRLSGRGRAEWAKLARQKQGALRRLAKGQCGDETDATARRCSTNAPGGIAVHQELSCED